MKGREIQERLKGKVDPELLIVLVAIGEMLSAQNQEIKLLADLQNRAMDVMLQLGTVTEQATNAVDELKKMREN